MDRLSATLLNREQLTRDDFTRTPEGGLQLSREALKRYFAAWEEALTEPMELADGALSFRGLFKRQAERMARTLRENVPYEGFRFPC